MKSIKALFALIVVALLATAIAAPTPARAAITQACPANWIRVLTGRGVLVCGKKNAAGVINTYVQWVNLDSGARIRNAYQVTGPAGSTTTKSPKFNVKLVRDWWTWSATGIASPPAGARFSAVNGSFFKFFPNQWDTEVSFPLKDRGTLISAGADATTDTKRVFGMYQSDTLSYMPDYTLSTNDWTQVSNHFANYSSVVVGFHPERIGISRYEAIPRTWVGLRDADGTGTFESVFILSTKASTQQQTLDMLAVEFQTVLNTQFDGSGSTQMVVRGSEYVSSTDGRKVPHSFVVYEAP